MNAAHELYDPLHPLWLDDPGPYGRYVGEAGRARTIASFCLAQNSATLDARPMRLDIVRFLLRDSALNHWRRSGRLASAGQDSSGRPLVGLSDAGLRECSGSLAGGGTRSTTPERVRELIARFLARPGASGARRFAP